MVEIPVDPCRKPANRLVSSPWMTRSETMATHDLAAVNTNQGRFSIEDSDAAAEVEVATLDPATGPQKPLVEGSTLTVHSEAAGKLWNVAVPTGIMDQGLPATPEKRCGNSRESVLEGCGVVCQADEATRKSGEAQQPEASNPAPGPKKRGRPRKVVIQGSTEAVNLAAGGNGCTEAGSKAADEYSEARPKKRGRPKKLAVQVQDEASKEEATNKGSPRPAHHEAANVDLAARFKKRGRLKKLTIEGSHEAVKLVAANEGCNETDSKAAEVDPLTIPKKRGRPRKRATAGSDEAAQTDGAIQRSVESSQAEAANVGPPPGVQAVELVTPHEAVELVAANEGCNETDSKAQEVDPLTRPKKRGRPRKRATAASDEAGQTEGASQRSVESSQAEAANVGPPPGVQAVELVTANEGCNETDLKAAEVDPLTRPKKRGRPRKRATAGSDEAVQIDGASQRSAEPSLAEAAKVGPPPGPRKRGRPRKVVLEVLDVAKVLDAANKDSGEAEPRVDAEVDTQESAGKLVMQGSDEAMKAADNDSAAATQLNPADVDCPSGPETWGRSENVEIKSSDDALLPPLAREDGDVLDLEGARGETEKVLMKPASVPDLSRPPEPQTPLKLASQGCNEILQPLSDCKDNGEPSKTQGHEVHPKAASLNSSVTSSKPARENPKRIEAGRGLPSTSCSPRRTRSMANKLLEGTVLRTPVPASPERLTTSDSEEAMQPDDDSDDEYVRVIRSSRSTDANLATNSEEGRLVVGSLPYCLDGEPSECIQWRAQAFADVWNCLEEHIQNAQRKQNKSTFDTIQHWIWTTHSSSQQSKLYAHTANTTGEGVVWPATEGIQSKQLNTGLLLLGGVDPADQEGTFDELAVQLESANCHVAALTPSDFLCRGGVAGPLRSLLKQFVSIDPDTTDLEILASWYREPANQGRPVVVLIESAESSRAEVLAHLIVALSELISQIPMFLVLGLATTAESLRKTLPANALERLKSCKFSLRSPVERLEAVVSEALVSTFCGFEIGHSVAAFMEAYFKTHDLTISFLLRSLKVACVEHFSSEPLSFLCSKLLHARTKSALEEDCLNFPDVLLKYASSLQSLRRMLDSDINGGQLSSQQIATLLWELREHKSRWCMALQCLHQAGKHAHHSFVSLFSKALKPSCSDFADILSIVRNLPRSTLSGLLDEWKTETAHVKELALEVVALKGKLEAGVTCEARDARPVPQAGMNKKQLRSLQLSLMKQMHPTIQNSDTKSVGTLAAEFLQRIVEKFLIPVETLPLHEVVCFKKEVLIKQAVSGEIRRRVHSDLVQSQSCLQCECCASGQSFSPTSPDACISFCLAEEHNDHINVHDWYQSFAAVFSSCNSTQHTPVKKKERGRSRKNGTSVEPGSKAIIQAKFSKAAAELQLLGLVRFPKKKRPDFIQRAAFGF